MDENQEKLLRAIMAESFTAFDLHLYLNTHPNDQRALMLFTTSSQRARMLMDRYESFYGPLTASASRQIPWQWIESPWPWE